MNCARCGKSEVVHNMMGADDVPYRDQDGCRYISREGIDALESALTQAQAERERFREGLEQIGCWENPGASDDYNRAWHEASAYANKVIEGSIDSTLDHVQAQLATAQANCDALQVEVDRLSDKLRPIEDVRQERDQFADAIRALKPSVDALIGERDALRAKLDEYEKAPALRQQPEA